MATTNDLLRQALDAVDAAKRSSEDDDHHVEVMYQCSMAQEALIKAIRAIGKPYSVGGA